MKPGPLDCLLTNLGQEAQSVAKEISKPLFPIEVVATIAARLLQGENYAEAVSKARALLHECRKAEFATRRRLADREMEYAKQKERLVPYKKALRKITGTDNEADSTKGLRDLLKADALQHVKNPHEKEAVLKEVTAMMPAWLANKKRTGFTGAVIDELREAYLALFPRRRPKPRTPRKK